MAATFVVSPKTGQSVSIVEFHPLQLLEFARFNTVKYAVLKDRRGGA